MKYYENKEERKNEKMKIIMKEKITLRSIYRRTFQIAQNTLKTNNMKYNRNEELKCVKWIKHSNKGT